MYLYSVKMVVKKDEWNQGDGLVLLKHEKRHRSSSFIRQDGQLARTTFLIPSEIVKNHELSPKKQSLFSKLFGSM